MAKVELNPGDYVLTEGMSEEDYHRVLRGFMAAGAIPRGDCGYKNGGVFLGWDGRDDELWHCTFVADGFRSRQLNIEQVLGEPEMPEMP